MFPRRSTMKRWYPRTFNSRIGIVEGFWRSSDTDRGKVAESDVADIGGGDKPMSRLRGR